MQAERDFYEPRPASKLIATLAASFLLASLETARLRRISLLPTALCRISRAGPIRPRILARREPSADRASPLSEKLGKSGGVIRPPANIAPDMAVRPPTPIPGPPGSSRLPARPEEIPRLYRSEGRGGDVHTRRTGAHRSHRRARSQNHGRVPVMRGPASEITTWAAEIRERRPSRGELEALIDATCGS